MKKSHLSAAVCAILIFSTTVNSEPPASGQSVPALRQTIAPSQFVGFSAATFDGDQGIVIYTNACQQSFPDSHMCTSEEFLNTKVYPETEGIGWIRPVFVPLSVSTTVESRRVFAADISGVTNDVTSFTCNGWDPGTTASGLAVNSLGKFFLRGCNASISVACCK